MLHSGELNANSEREAFAVLQHQGLVAFELKEIEKNIADKFIDWIEQKKIGEKWTALFFRQLSTTLDVMTLNDALGLFEQSTKDSAQKQIIQSMLKDIKVGKTLAEAMEPHSLIFPYNVVQMIVIAQRSGRMQEITARLAEQLEKSYKSRQKLHSALYYPAFVFVIAMISIVILLNVVLPTFASFFASQDTNLPLLTQFFLSVGLFFAENFLIIIVLAITLVVTCIGIYQHSPAMQLFVARYLLKIPFFGTLIEQREWMNAFSSLAFLLESGVQMDVAVEMVARASSNKYFSNLWLEIKFKVERGEKLVSESFPAEYQGLITMGEASGTLPEMLKRCYMLSEFEVEEMSNQIPIKAEIFGTLFIGIIVALIVFSVILPVLSINI